MMAKMFYRFDEARQILGMSDEQLKQLTREGKLREFRDGAQVMYKADQVDQLRGELGLGGGETDIGPSDTGGPIGLSDTRSDPGSGLGGTLGGSLTGTSGGSVISLADSSSKDDTATDLALTGSGSGSGMPLAPGNSGTAIPLGGTATGINLSNTGTGIPLSSTGTGTGIPLSGTGTGINLSKTGSSMPPPRSSTGSGVSVLGLDEGGNADPSAATAMGGSFGGEPSLEAMGSGSGLLDLSREQDDTSLGAPVLDQISAGTRAGGSSIGSLASAPQLSGGPTAAAAAARAGAMPVYVEATDNFTGFAAGAAGGAAILCVVALYAVISGALRAQPNLISFLYAGEGTARAAWPMLWVLGLGLVLAVIFGVVGFALGKKK